LSNGLHTGVRSRGTEFDTRSLPVGLWLTSAIHHR